MPLQRERIDIIMQQEQVCGFNDAASAVDLTLFMNEREVKEYLHNRLGRLVYDLTALAAVEFGLIRLVSSSDNKIERVDLPLDVLPQDVRLAIAKYDTTDTKPCRTAERILAGDIYPQDIFLFTGDLQKYSVLVEEHHDSLEEGLDHFSTRLEEHLNRSANLVSYLISGMWADFQQVVWRLRLLVMMEAKERVSREDGIREVLRDFRNKWYPPSTSGYDLSNFRTGGGSGSPIPIG